MADKVWRNVNGLTMEELKSGGSLTTRDEASGTLEPLPWAQLEFKFEKGQLADVLVCINGEIVGRLPTIRASLDAAPEGCTWVVRTIADEADVHRTVKP